MSSSPPPPPPPRPSLSPTLLDLPPDVLSYICHYLWPPDIAHLTFTCPTLSIHNYNHLIHHGLSFFRPREPLSLAVVEEVLLRRIVKLYALRILDLSSVEITPGLLREWGRVVAAAAVGAEGGGRGEGKEEEGEGEMSMEVENATASTAAAAAASTGTHTYPTTEPPPPTFCTTLRTLNFFDNKPHLGQEGLRALTQTLSLGPFRHSLKQLYIRKNSLESEDVALLIQALTEGACLCLDSLSLAQNDLDAETGVALGRALSLSSPPPPSSLALPSSTFEPTWRCSFSPRPPSPSSASFPSSLHFYPPLRMLKKLDLHLNRLGNRGAAALAEGLVGGWVEGGGLRTGGIGEGEDRYRGFERGDMREISREEKELEEKQWRGRDGKEYPPGYYMADDIGAMDEYEADTPHMPFLEELYLGYNEIGDEGADAIAYALQRKHVPRLRDLDLACNLIGDEGAKALGYRVGAGRYAKWEGEKKGRWFVTQTWDLPLQTVDLRGNRIKEYGVVTLCDLLREGMESVAGATQPEGIHTEVLHFWCALGLKAVYLDDNPGVRTAGGRRSMEDLWYARDIVCSYSSSVEG